MQVIVGVHQVDERPQTLPHAAQRRCPYIVPAGENLAQQRAEGVAQRVQIVAARALQHIELVEHRSDFAHLAGPALAQSGQIRLKPLRLCQTGAAVVVLPVVHKIIVCQRGSHVGRIFGKRIVGAGALFKGMGSTATRSKGGGLIVQRSQQDADERHIIAQRQLPGAAVTATQRLAQPAVIALIALHLGICQTLAVNRNISKHTASTLFDELVAALGAGDADFTAPARHAQLLAALGAAVIVIFFALLESHLLFGEPRCSAALIGKIF